MAYTMTDVLDGVRQSRARFLKHLDGVREDQWDWKPYPECNSLRETLIHLIGNDRAVVQGLAQGGMPDFEALGKELQALTEGKQIPELLALLSESHQALLDFMRDRYGNAPLDTEATLFGITMKLAQGVGFLSNEDSYHAGQVSFIRLATDPGWDYFGTVYGQ